MSEAYVGKSIGARRFTGFKLLDDPEGGGTPTYDVAKKLSRLINIQVSPVFAEGTLESDDGIEDDLSLVVAFDVTINASQLTDDLRAWLLGHSIDAGGGILTTGSDVAPEIALAWEELLSKKSGPDLYKKVVLYKGKFKEFQETANTKTQSGVTFQTHNLTGRFYRRNDGALKYSMREDTPDADPLKLANWFTTPQEYGAPYAETAATPTATPGAGAVAADTEVALATVTAGAVVYYTLDGSTPTEESMLYDDPIVINVAKTIKAIAVRPGMNNSAVLTAEYTISGG